MESNQDGGEGQGIIGFIHLLMMLLNDRAKYLNHKVNNTEIIRYKL